jgi:hypothetical protein
MLRGVRLEGVDCICLTHSLSLSFITFPFFHHFLSLPPSPSHMHTHTHGFSANGSVATYGYVTIVKAYECPVEACAENNTCKGGRTGLLCGYCPVGMALELNVCVKCGRDAATQRIVQVIVGSFVLTLIFLVLFLIGWRHVYPANIVHRTYDLMRKKIFSLMEHIAERFRKKGHTSTSNVDLMNARRSIQGAKVFFAYYQVVTGFIVFKVPLPDILQQTIRFLHAMGQILSLDFFEYPGFGCLVTMGWGDKLVIRTLTPLVILALMTVPVAVSQFHLRNVERGSHQEDISSESRRGLQRKILKARYNLDQTRNACWNNVLSLLFLVFPSMTLASMEAFSCRRIGNTWYLNSDLQQICPSAGGGQVFSFWYSVFMTAVWTAGCPTFILWCMMRHNIRWMVDQKMKLSVVREMIDRYLEDSVDPGRRRLANVIGKGVTKVGDSTAGDEMFERRSADLYKIIFPDHAECGNGCVGHSLPLLFSTILRKALSFKKASGLTWHSCGSTKPTEGMHLDHVVLANALMEKRKTLDLHHILPTEALTEVTTEEITFEPREWDAFYIKNLCMHHFVESDGCFFKPFDPARGTRLTLPDLKSAIRQWFEYIDINLNSLLDRDELRREFSELGLGEAAADAVLIHFDFDGNLQLDIMEFEVGVLHILDSSFPSLKFTDALVLFSSLTGVDSSTPISLECFQQSLKSLCLMALTFTGAERAESLTGQQLLALLDHKWKRFKMGQVGSVDHIDMQLEESDVFEDAPRENGQKPLSKPTEEEESCKPAEKEMLKRFSSELAQCKDFCKKFNISAHNMDIQKATVWNLPDVYDVMIGALNRVLPVSSIETAANSDIKRIFSLRQKIIRNKDVFTGLLLQDVQQLGRDLMDEGVLKISPLEWDGALGPREVEIIERLGFLLDAYDASVWYWEVKIQTPLLLCWC